MKTCFSTLGCPEWSFKEIVSVASDLGYDGIEIRGIQRHLFAPDIPAFALDRQDATKQKLRQLSLTIPCLTSSCNLGFEDDLEPAKAYIDTASTMDIPYVRLLADKAPAPTDGVDLEMLSRQFKEITDYAKDRNVLPLVETNGFFAKTKVLGALLRQMDPNRIGVLYDIHHPYRFFGESPAYTIGNIGAYIRHVHIKDSVMNGKKVVYKMVGEGDIPVKTAIRSLIDAGYQGYFSLEWVKRWDLSLEEPGIAFAQYKEFMDAL